MIGMAIPPRCENMEIKKSAGKMRPLTRKIERFPVKARFLLLFFSFFWFFENCTQGLG